MATATLPSGQTVTVTIKDGKTQTGGLPPGTVVHTGGGDYTITGGAGGNYSGNKTGGGSSGGSSGGGIAGPNDGSTAMEGGGIPGEITGTPIIGGMPDITNKVDPVEDPSSRYIEELACKDVPGANPNLVQNYVDFDEEVF